VTILDEILARKGTEIAAAKARVSAVEMQARARAESGSCRGFRAALLGAGFPAVIAEVKRRSPSKGEIRPDFDPVACARAYAENGAAALSVLTDEHYFGGHLDYLRAIHAEVGLPILRKDFVVDGYQIDEARVAGADAVLLIVAGLEDELLRALHGRARELGLDVLVEVHDEGELERALGLEADLLGVNNRNLHTFQTDLAVTEKLAARLFGRESEARAGEILLVAESGIRSLQDLERLEAAGAGAFLVGESLMRQPDPGAALMKLRLG
jgi:indole-3-glycerol phosphate synthase